MNKNEIKKRLYKEKPIAVRTKEEKGYRYITETSEEKVEFFVPYEEMGMTVFDEEISAQFLIRWLT